MTDLTWVEISEGALRENMLSFRRLVGDDVILCPCVKGNAYGHGLVEASQIFLDSGANWLGVNALYEAKKLRENGIACPIYILGYVGLDELEAAISLGCRVVVYNMESMAKIAELVAKLGKEAFVHLKVETGSNRQGLKGEELLELARMGTGAEGVTVEGICTHFANIEDTTDHSFALRQFKRFGEEVAMLKENGIDIPIRHLANSAASMIFGETHFEMVRPGISTYGMWPSNETFVSYLKEHGEEFGIKPALTWKAKIAQIKDLPAGEYVGYGCTYRATHASRLAILPIGYYDGYDRGVRGGHVLIHGKRAPIRGRICMNIMMVDITDIPEARLEDEAILMGRDGEEEISADLFASWAGTINYEVTTRINERIARRVCLRPGFKPGFRQIR